MYAYLNYDLLIGHIVRLIITRFYPELMQIGH